MLFGIEGWDDLTYRHPSPRGLGKPDPGIRTLTSDLRLKGAHTLHPDCTPAPDSVASFRILECFGRVSGSPRLASLTASARMSCKVR